MNSTISLFNIKKNFAFSTLFCFLVSLAISCVKPSPVNYRCLSYTEVFKIAEKENKRVFVLITDSSCPSCHKFEDAIEKNSATKKILDEQYICYKADIKDDQGLKIAQIVKCPSYPFPYFFKSDGELLAFGFPNSRDFDISNLSLIGISEDRFAELFRLATSTNGYKQLISMNMKAALLKERGDIKNMKLSEILMLKSLQISAYPYNLQAVNTVRPNSSEYDSLLNHIRKYEETVSDLTIYGTLNDYLNFDINRKVLPVPTSSEYEFDRRSANLGTLTEHSPMPFKFTITNISNHEIKIKSVTHPCDCIRLRVIVDRLKKGQKTDVEGTFTPYQDGPFDKDIFVHTNSAIKPMDIFKITGITNNN